MYLEKAKRLLIWNGGNNTELKHGADDKKLYLLQFSSSRLTHPVVSSVIC